MLRCLVALLFVVQMSSAAVAQSTGKQRVYLGCYTGADKSRGIYRCELDLAAGQLSEPQLAAPAVNPSFLALDPTNRYLYACSEVATQDGKKTGGVNAFAIDSATGDLTHLNGQPSGGSGPCHVRVDRVGQTVLVANYGGGSCGALPILADGKLAPLSSFHQHEGSSVRPNQKGPHAHSVNIDAAGKFAFVADLGLDRVMIYRLDSAAHTLTPNDPPAGEMKPGEGPRHTAFHPTGKWLYVNGEMGMSVTTFDYDAPAGKLTAKQTVSTLPPDTDTKGLSTAEVVVHPTGKFVYVSNRGHHSIAAFTVDQTTGTLTPAGHFARDVRVPRNFNIDPTGRYALVAGQESDNVVVFAIDAATGALTPTGSAVKVSKPVCVKFVEL